MKQTFIVSLHSAFEWKKPIRYLAWAIRKVTKSYWNHTAILHDGIIYESDVQGIVMIPFENWCNQIGKSTIQISLPESKPNIKRAIQKVGIAKYDFRALLIKHLIYTYFGVWIKSRKGKEGERFTCSEFAAYVIDTENPHLKTPSDMSKLGTPLYTGTVETPENIIRTLN